MNAVSTKPNRWAITAAWVRLRSPGARRGPPRRLDHPSGRVVRDQESERARRVTAGSGRYQDNDPSLVRLRVPARAEPVCAATSRV
ncbi:hypothetical protein Mro03_35770 [Microbispora rosea subsp. rosea]|nr:hypothetical protein Mro03_35770 [Microbispora rosea subsp. rosea]